MDLEVFRLIKASEEYSGTKIITNTANSIHWDLSHCIFVEKYCIDRDLKIFIEEKIEQIQKLGILKVYIDSERSKRVIEEVFKDWSVNLYKRKIYKGNVNTNFQNNLSCRDVSSIIASGQQYANLEALMDEILGTWGDVASFMQKGFGVCNVDNNCIRGWCLSEYNSPGKCGVGIETIEEYQRKGIAFGMTQSFLNRCKDRNIVPYWDSWEWNEGSIKTAERSGFDLLQKYQTYFIKSN